MSSRYPLDPNSAAAAQLRSSLQARQQSLRGEVDATRSRNAGAPGRVSREATDRSEEAVAQVEAGLDDAEVARDQAELSAIAEALSRLDAGRYGLCKDCDEAIDPRRLAAEPFAVRCTGCQGRFELAGAR
ncbi:MAG: TraR/DksA C4-type zinc finger protein [Piscinibacter sp.]